MKLIYLENKNCQYCVNENIDEEDTLQKSMVFVCYEKSTGEITIGGLIYKSDYREDGIYDIITNPNINLIKAAEKYFSYTDKKVCDGKCFDCLHCADEIENCSELI